ncbi:hypothetical protein BFW25_10095 [Aeromonas caviae]|nr:hypothetical protein BFW25_10095 [Aeromonas caviae]
MEFIILIVITYNLWTIFCDFFFLTSIIRVDISILIIMLTINNNQGINNFPFNRSAKSFYF